MLVVSHQTDQPPEICACTMAPHTLEIDIFSALFAIFLLCLLLRVKFKACTGDILQDDVSVKIMAWQICKMYYAKYVYKSNTKKKQINSLVIRNLKWYT